MKPKADFEFLSIFLAVREASLGILVALFFWLVVVKDLVLRLYLAAVLPRWVRLPCRRVLAPDDGRIDDAPAPCAPAG